MGSGSPDDTGGDIYGWIVMTCENIEQLLIVSVFGLAALAVGLGAVAWILDERVRQQEQCIKRLEATKWQQVRRDMDNSDSVNKGETFLFD